MSNDPLPEHVSRIETMVVNIDLPGLNMIKKLEGRLPLIAENRAPLSREEMIRIQDEKGVFRIILAIPVEEFITALREKTEIAYIQERVADFPIAKNRTQYLTIHATVEAFHFIEYGVMKPTES